MLLNIIQAYLKETHYLTNSYIFILISLLLDKTESILYIFDENVNNEQKINRFFKVIIMLTLEFKFQTFTIIN